MRRIDHGPLLVGNAGIGVFYPTHDFGFDVVASPDLETVRSTNRLRLPPGQDSCSPCLRLSWRHNDCQRHHQEGDGVQR